MSKVYRLEQSQFFPKSREEVFTFFADASNLERITPRSSIFTSAIRLCMHLDHGP